jgi:hypothetical protein
MRKFIKKKRSFYSLIENATAQIATEKLSFPDGDWRFGYRKPPVSAGLVSQLQCSTCAGIGSWVLKKDGNRELWGVELTLVNASQLLQIGHISYYRDKFLLPPIYVEGRVFAWIMYRNGE